MARLGMLEVKIRYRKKMAPGFVRPVAVDSK